MDARSRQDLVAPTCLFAMQYLRYMAEDSESWDETKEHESRTTREEELVRDGRREGCGVERERDSG